MIVRTLLLFFFIACLLPFSSSALEDTAQTSPTQIVKTIVQEPEKSIHDLSPWGMYQAADVVVKSVLIGLIAASVLTWTILLFKVIQINSSRRQAKSLLNNLTQSKSFSGINKQFDPSYPDLLILVDSYRHEIELSHNMSQQGIKERVDATLNRAQASIIANINNGTGLLATIGSVAPFVGLFGTVWGIMNSFIGIAHSQTTNLAVVAPGIAEALLATAAGLLAAIPAVVIYNYFSRSIGTFRAALTDITTALMILLSRDLDRQNPLAKPLALKDAS
jgi:biopolymer transport protein ExbB